MQRTNRIYEAPSRLSQGLVVGLSAAVVVMAAWLAVTITFSQSATTSAESATDATASPPDVTAASAAPDTLRPAARSVHFDWPEQFASATARPSAPPPAQTALPLAPIELPIVRELGRSPWPVAVTGDRDRSLPSRRPAGGAAATEVVVDIPAPSASPRTASPRETTAPMPRQAQRRQKPRVENEAAQ